MKTHFLMCLVCALPLVAGGAEEVVAGPAAVNVTQRGATIVWLASDAQSTLGESPTEQKLSARSLSVRKTVYTGLKAGTTYYYELPNGVKGSFKTAPPNGTSTFSFVVFGDTRTRNDVHAKVIAAIAKAEPDFILHTGDLVADGFDTSLWPTYFKIENPVLSKAALYPALGNHEKGAPQYYEYLDQKSGYYSFNWGTAHFAVLNSDIGNAASGRAAQERYWKEQVAWLEQDLEKNQNAEFLFVTCHHPPFTAVKNRQGESPHMIALVPLLEKYRVNAMINGHDHNYQHFEKSGIHYVTSGGGGAPLYPVDLPPAGITRKVEMTENFVRVRIDGKKAQVDATGTDGRIIDHFELTAR